MSRIACIVVTYNRYNVLKRCLYAIHTQSYKPCSVYIVDNASTDGTCDKVKEWNLFNTTKDGIVYKYILNERNEGGAGGFNKGMKTAMEDSDYDALWVMDDDGEPEMNCLENLVSLLGRYDYIAPIVLSDEDHNTCSFIPNSDYGMIKYQASEIGVIEDWASPFNGVLFSKKLINTIGYPMVSLFIWGDEKNYHMRARNAGFVPVTSVSAVHFHPMDRMKYDDTPFGRIVHIEADWKFYCYLRNLVYNTVYVDSSVSHIHGFFRSIHFCARFFLYYLLLSDNKKRVLIVVDAFFSGLLRLFGGMEKYR